jgi:hypothetical protein
MDSKRRTERKPMFRVCRYTVSGREYADLSTNISSKGIFIKNFSPPEVGTAILLTVKLPDEWGNLPMKIIGRVAHVNDDPDPHKRGMGIEFISVIADSVPIIEYFVREVYKQESIDRAELERTTSDTDEGEQYQYNILKKDEDQP